MIVYLLDFMVIMLRMILILMISEWFDFVKDFVDFVLDSFYCLDGVLIFVVLELELNVDVIVNWIRMGLVLLVYLDIFKK